MAAAHTLRIDKWMWAVRLFKTRTLAADACKGGKVKVLGDSVKSSKEVKAEDVITISYGIITKTIKIKELTEKRLGAKLIADYYTDLTPEAEYEKQKLFNATQALNRPRGLGRPTKKERRDIDKWDGWDEL